MDTQRASCFRKLRRPTGFQGTSIIGEIYFFSILILSFASTFEKATGELDVPSVIASGETFVNANTSKQLGAVRHGQQTHQNVAGIEQTGEPPEGRRELEPSSSDSQRRPGDRTFQHTSESRWEDWERLPSLAPRANTPLLALKELADKEDAQESSTSHHQRTKQLRGTGNEDPKAQLSKWHQPNKVLALPEESIEKPTVLSQVEEVLGVSLSFWAQNAPGRRQLGERHGKAAGSTTTTTTGAPPTPVSLPAPVQPTSTSPIGTSTAHTSAFSITTTTGPAAISHNQSDAISLLGSLSASDNETSAMSGGTATTTPGPPATTAPRTAPRSTTAEAQMSGIEDTSAAPAEATTMSTPAPTDTTTTGLAVEKSGMEGTSAAAATHTTTTAPDPTTNTTPMHTFTVADSVMSSGAGSVESTPNSDVSHDETTFGGSDQD